MTIAGLTMPAMRGILLHRKSRRGTAAVGVTGRRPMLKDLRPIPVCGSSIRPLDDQRRLAEQRRRALSERR